MIVTLENLYFVPLPISLVRSLHLRKGDRLQCLEGDGEIRLRPVAPSSEVEGSKPAIPQAPFLSKRLRHRSLKSAASENSACWSTGSTLRCPSKKVPSFWPI